MVNAGWSSPVARQAHNLKVVSSNLAPATTFLHTLRFSNALPLVERALPIVWLAAPRRCDFLWKFDPHNRLRQFRGWLSCFVIVWWEGTPCCFALFLGRSLTGPV